eukprot:722546_1
MFIGLDNSKPIYTGNSHHVLKHKYPSKRQPQKRLKSYYSEQSMKSSYGIKLPRLTQSILKEKNRRDSKEMHSPKSTFSAPIWNRDAPNMNDIDDFFTKTSDDGLDGLESHRTSNNTMFLPKINRSKLKPKSRVKVTANGRKYNNTK